MIPPEIFTRWQAKLIKFGYGCFAVWIAACWLGCQSPGRRPARATQESPVAANAPVARFPFELAGDHIFVRVRVNGHGPYSFVVDTGASRSSFSEKLARDLKLPRWPFHVKAQALGGWANLYVLRGIQLEIGGVKHTPCPMTSLDLPDFGQRPLDGLLGADFFRRFVVEMDFAAREIRLFNPQTWKPEPGFAALPIRFHNGVPLIPAQVGKGPGDKASGRFMIDSGYSGWLMLTESFIRSNHLFQVAGELVPERGADAVGSLERARGRVPSLALGPFELSQPIVHFERHPLLNPNGLAGTLGTGLLRRFQLVFDYRHRKLWLKPGSDFNQPFSWTWEGPMMRVNVDGFALRFSGASFTASAPGFHEFVITRLVAPSPAFAAGLQLGDKLVRFNGVRPGDMSLKQWMELARPSTHSAQLVVQRGSETLAITLPLEWDSFQEIPSQVDSAPALKVP